MSGSDPEGAAPGPAKEDWTLRFPGLANLPSASRAIPRSRTHIARLERFTAIFGPGKAQEHLLVPLDGTIRVQQAIESGREVFRYRVNACESCVLTTACLLGYEYFAAEAVAETQVRAALVPREAFVVLVAQSTEFRRFVFTAISRRITDLFVIFDELAFRRIYVRLARELVAAAGQGSDVQTTHQALAAELGTAHEVISRQLQDFQRSGWVELARSGLKVTAPAALDRLARS
jgi:CRP/FNR family transcriptional regulator